MNTIKKTDLVNKKLLLLFVLPAFVAICLLATALGHPKVQIEGYVYDSCGGCFADNLPCKPCTVVLELEQYLGLELTRLGKSEQSEAAVHNLLYDEPKAKLAERLSPEQLKAAEYPILFVNGQVLYGWQQIREQFALLVSEETGSRVPDAGADAAHPRVELLPATEDTLVYFKMQSCRSCKDAQALLDTLVDESCKLLVYDLADEGVLELFDAYCKTYGLDSATATVPLVFIGDTALEGYPEMEIFLAPYLKEGRQATTYCPTTK